VSSGKTTREYIAIAPGQLYPFAKDIYYECLICGDVIPSTPDDSLSCKCDNVIIDAPQGRMNTADPTRVRLFRAVRG
jgi:hypothetical protein